MGVLWERNRGLGVNIRGEVRNVGLTLSFWVRWPRLFLGNERERERIS